MISFKNLFGVQPEEVQKNCVISPFLTKGLTDCLHVEELSKGKPYSAGQSDHFTFIHTQIGAPKVGDAVLYLEETACENIILF